MIKTEHGLTFARDGDSWRCVERPELRMYSDGTYGFDDDPHRYQSTSDALATRDGVKSVEPSRRRRRGR